MTHLRWALDLREEHSVSQGQGLPSEKKVVWLHLIVCYLSTSCDTLLSVFGTFALSSVSPVGDRELDTLLAVCSDSALLGQESQKKCVGTKMSLSQEQVVDECWS